MLPTRVLLRSRTLPHTTRSPSRTAPRMPIHSDELTGMGSTTLITMKHTADSR